MLFYNIWKKIIQMNTITSLKKFSKNSSKNFLKLIENIQKKFKKIKKFVSYFELFLKILVSF